MALWDINLQGLIDELAYLINDKDDCIVFAKEANIDISRINITGNARINWHSIVDEAQKVEKVLHIIEKALQRYSNSVDLNVAKCYILSQSQQPKVISSLIMVSTANDTNDDLIVSLLEHIVQLQRIAQFLQCWQNISIQANEKLSKSPLFFEQYDSIVFLLKCLVSTIKYVKRSLNYNYEISSNLEYLKIISEADVIATKIDNVLYDIQSLSFLNNKEAIHAVDVREKIQSQLMEVIRSLLHKDGRIANIYRSSFLQEFLTSSGEISRYVAPTLIEKEEPNVPTSIEKERPTSSAGLGLQSKESKILTKQDIREIIFEYFNEIEFRVIWHDKVGR